MPQSSLYLELLRLDADSVQLLHHGVDHSIRDHNVACWNPAPHPRQQALKYALDREAGLSVPV